MKIGFEDARGIADANYRHSYGTEQYPGTFMVAPYGWEDDEHINVVIGAREWLEKGNQAFAPPEDDRTILVNREDGRVQEVNYMFEREKLEAMKPVGTGHPMEDE